MLQRPVDTSGRTKVRRENKPAWLSHLDTAANTNPKPYGGVLVGSTTVCKPWRLTLHHPCSTTYHACLCLDCTVECLKVLTGPAQHQQVSHRVVKWQALPLVKLLNRVGELIVWTSCRLCRGRGGVAPLQRAAAGCWRLNPFANSPAEGSYLGRQCHSCCEHTCLCVTIPSLLFEKQS
jgi:hypothetical protein